MRISEKAKQNKKTEGKNWWIIEINFFVRPTYEKDQ